MNSGCRHADRRPAQATLLNCKSAQRPDGDGSAWDVLGIGNVTTVVARQAPATAMLMFFTRYHAPPRHELAVNIADRATGETLVERAIIIDQPPEISREGFTVAVEIPVMVRASVNTLVSLLVDGQVLATSDHTIRLVTPHPVAEDSHQ